MNSSSQFQQQIRLYVLLKCFFIVIILQHDMLLILYYLLLLGFMDIHSQFWMNFSLTYPLRGLQMDGLHWRSDQPQNRHYIVRSVNNILLERIFECPLLQSRPLLPHLSPHPHYGGPLHVVVHTFFVRHGGGAAFPPLLIARIMFLFIITCVVIIGALHKEDVFQWMNCV